MFRNLQNISDHTVQFQTGSDLFFLSNWKNKKYLVFMYSWNKDINHNQIHGHVFGMTF